MICEILHRHTYKHTYTQNTRTCTCTHAPTRIRTHTYTHNNTHTHSHTRTLYLGGYRNVSKRTPLCFSHECQHYGVTPPPAPPLFLFHLKIDQSKKQTKCRRKQIAHANTSLKPPSASHGTHAATHCRTLQPPTHIEQVL